MWAVERIWGCFHNTIQEQLKNRLGGHWRLSFRKEYVIYELVIYQGGTWWFWEGSWVYQLYDWVRSLGRRDERWQACRIYYYYAIKVGKMVTHVHLLGTPDIFCLRINFLIDQNKSIGYTFLSDENTFYQIWGDKQTNVSLPRGTTR